MSLAMSHDDRTTFLAGAHLGVLTTGADGSRAPLAAPIWYGVDAEGTIRVITGASSQKAAAIEATGRFGIVVHEEVRPFRYVSVEGPVVERRPCELARDLLPMAVRYLGDEAGQAYADQWLSWNSDDVVYQMRPERWGSADHTAIYAPLPGWSD
jgi:uncharacterized protein